MQESIKVTLLARLLGLEEEASHLAVIDEIQRLIVFKEGHRMCKYAVEGLEQKIVALECVLANKGLDMVRQEIIAQRKKVNGKMSKVQNEDNV